MKLMPDGGRETGTEEGRLLLVIIIFVGSRVYNHHSHAHMGVIR